MGGSFSVVFMSGQDIIGRGRPGPGNSCAKRMASPMAAPALLPDNIRMQVVERSALVTYTPAQMFALVNDVARYPDFLPWCIGAKVDEVSAAERIATLKISRGLLQTEFTTRNTLLQDAQIQMQLMHGPFRDLTGLWRF